MMTRSSRRATVSNSRPTTERVRDRRRGSHHDRRPEDAAQRRASPACRSETSTGQLDDLVFREARGVTQGFVDVRRFKVGVCAEDLVATLAGGQQPQQSRHGETQIPDAWLPGANVRAHRDPRELHWSSRAQYNATPALAGEDPGQAATPRTSAVGSRLRSARSGFAPISTLSLFPRLTRSVINHMFS